MSKFIGHAASSFATELRETRPASFYFYFPFFIFFNTISLNRRYTPGSFLLQSRLRNFYYTAIYAYVSLSCEQQPELKTTVASSWMVKTRNTRKSLNSFCLAQNYLAAVRKSGVNCYARVQAIIWALEITHFAIVKLAILASTSRSLHSSRTLGNCRATTFRRINPPPPDILSLCPNSYTGTRKHQVPARYYFFFFF